MTSRSPWPISTEIDGAAEPRPQRAAGAGRRARRSRPSCPGSCRGRWCRRARRRCRARRGSSSSRRSRTARRARAGSAPTARLARRAERRVGERLADAVGVQQAGYVDLAVVHLPPLGPPRHVAHHAPRRPRRPRAARRGHMSTQAPRVSSRRSTPVEGRRLDGRRLEQRTLEVHGPSIRRDRTDVRSTVRVGSGVGSGSIPVAPADRRHGRVGAMTEAARQRRAARGARPQPDQDLRHRPGAGDAPSTT